MTDQYNNKNELNHIVLPEFFAHGFGIVSRLVMQATNLSSNAKLLYCLLSVYAGEKNYAWPSTKRLLEELNWAENTFYKYRNELVSVGLISWNQKPIPHGSIVVYVLDYESFKAVLPEETSVFSYESLTCSEDTPQNLQGVEIVPDIDLQNPSSEDTPQILQGVEDGGHPSNFEEGHPSNFEVDTPQNLRTYNNIDKEHIYKNNIKKNIYKKKDRENEGNSVREKRISFTPPSLSEVQLYIEEEGLAVDPEKFFDYYTANGWMLGKSAMQDWRATLRNWNRRDKHNRKEDDEIVITEEIRRLCEHF